MTITINVEGAKPSKFIKYDQYLAALTALLYGDAPVHGLTKHDPIVAMTVYAAKEKGKTFRQIESELGVPRSTAHRLHSNVAKAITGLKH